MSPDDKIFKAGAEMVPINPATSERHIALCLLRAQDRERAVVAFLKELRDNAPDHTVGLMAVEEVNWPALNTIAVAVLGNELNCNAPPLVREFLDRERKKQDEEYPE